MALIDDIRNRTWFMGQAPQQSQIEEWFKRFETRTGCGLALSPRSLAMRLKGLSFAEIEDFGTDVLRRILLDQPNANAKRIIDQRLHYWSKRFTVKQSDGYEERD